MRAVSRRMGSQRGRRVGRGCGGRRGASWLSVSGGRELWT